MTPAPSFLEQLAAYQQLLAPQLRSMPLREPQKHLYALLDAHLSQLGKGLRPALCIATCRALGGQLDDVLPAAAALEQLHNAFLIHDDIEDGSEYRRDRPTMHVQHGIPLAVNAGDAMQAISLQTLRKSADRLGVETTWRLLDEFEHLLIESLEGQAMEIGWVHDNDTSIREDDYLRMALKKTCWYSFIQPCRIGALVANPGDADIDRFDRFGYFAGVAFQIQDDVLNLSADPHRYGKEIDGDLWEGKRTLMLIHLFRSLPPSELAQLSSVLARPRGRRLPREIEWIRQRLATHGSLQYAADVARSFATAASAEFERAFVALQDGPDKQFLRDFVDYMVERTY